MKYLTLLLIFISNLTIADTAKYSLLDDKLLLNIPTEMQLLTPKVMEKRFGGQKIMPYAAFSNSDQSATFTITQFNTPADKLSMKKIRKAISQMLRASNPKVDWKKDKLNSQFGTRVGIFEYEEKGIGKYSYNITYALPVDGQLTFVAFLLTDKKYKYKWRDLARATFDAIELP
ncbi:MAG: hypothetical protein HWE10_15170 [Gammaproteobacteria bacterium]|nr:hypothetical protein [Gammaproteobacteria bacterium]